jgi:protein-S-isoprenylcysteine O-methyltransferase
MRRMLAGLAIAATITILPAAGNAAALAHPQLWLLLLLGILASVFQPSYSPFKKPVTPEDRGTAAQNVWSVYVTQLAAVLEAVYFRYPGSFRWDAVSSVALTVMLLGLVLRTWAVLTLGRWFTWYVTVQPGQRVIRSGPYRFLRHPSYAGALLSYVAGPLFLHAWVAALAAGILLPLAFQRRIRHEEALMKDCFGGQYERYCREVGALFPRPKLPWRGAPDPRGRAE